jgi:hypothetical protein
MSDFARTAIVGTGQVAASPADDTGTSADALVSAVGGLDRERAFLLRAGALAVMRRAGRVVSAEPRSLAPAPAETLRRPSEKLADMLEPLLRDGGGAIGGGGVLEETLELMARARIRLPEELLPAALWETAPALRRRIKPVLGERGVWLSRLREAWSWARSPLADGDELPADLKERWADGTNQERAVLLESALRSAPDVARMLVAEGWKQEKAEQRLEWLEMFEKHVAAQDEPWLTGALSDRSAHVRVQAARLLWRLPESDVARRARERADTLVSPASAAGGMLGKLKKLAGGGRPKIAIELPPETFDAAWEKEGIVETPPQGVGRRQWWLAQMIAAVPATHVVERLGVSVESFVETMVEHELGAPVLDGITTAALRDGARDWFAPLWDAWAKLEARAALSEQPLRHLTARLSPDEIEPRARLVLEKGERTDLLAAIPRPWPRRLAQAFLARLGSARPEWTPLLSVAALALPVELVPDVIALPESNAEDVTHQIFLRAFDQFQSTLAVRRGIAKEIAS